MKKIIASYEQREGRGLVYVSDAVRSETYEFGGQEPGDFLALYGRIAADFGIRAREVNVSAGGGECGGRVLLDKNVSPGILYGYGDPAVYRCDQVYYLYVTSNDAPDAFPILCSSDLATWTHEGFVFPRDHMPDWVESRPQFSDFWAPELQRVGDRYLLCFTARNKQDELCVGLAWSDDPAGPFNALDAPLIEGGVIDAHLFVSADREPILYWKEDSNDRWPALLVEMLVEGIVEPTLLFAEEEDRRTAELIVGLWPWISSLPPMQRFSALQPLIDACVYRFAQVRDRLGQVAGAEAVAAAMSTPIFAQRLSPDGTRLLGEKQVVLVNDQPWEGHLIEGPWLTKQEELYYLFYAGNDFSTPDYGIGVAVGPTPLGPFEKKAQPLLTSAAGMSGPGHPSIAQGLDGNPHLFFHAFPGKTGYKEFRALLTAGLRFSGGEVEISR